MTKTITLAVRAEDAEPWLRKAAEQAAKYSAWCDHITPRTHNPPRMYRETVAEAKKRWRIEFLLAKRLVESFEVEYEPTSEPETMTITYPFVGGTTKVMNVGGRIGKIGIRSGSTPDYNDPRPCYRGECHVEACRQAAERVVRRWRAMLAEAKAA